MKNLVIPKQRIAETATITPQDRVRINQCRGDHNRLGFAYQMAFVRLTGRFPLQVPLEIVEEIVGFVAYDLDISPQAITRYAQRQATVSAHQQQIREYLHLKLFEEAENELLNQFLSEEACRLEQTAALLAKTKEFLHTQRVVLPADSTLRRIIGEQREQARQYMFTRLMEMLSVECQQQLEELLAVSSSPSSLFQTLKEPPGFASSGALLHLVEKLECIQNTGILSLDISWLNNNLQKSLARRARQSSAWRVRILQPAHRYTVLTCFLWQTYHETIDHLVEMYHKLMTKVWRRAENELGEQVKKRRKWVRNTLRTLKAISIVLLDENLPDQDVRSTIFRDVPRETLKAQIAEAEEWLSGKHSDPFAFVMTRFSYLRQFAPSILEHLSFHSESEEKTSILKAIEVIQDLNRSHKRSLPDDAPVDFIPQRLQSFVKQDGHMNRRAYECAVLTHLRDEIQRGNLWVQDSKKYRKLDD